MTDALEKLGKWRTLLTGWHLGSKTMFDPGVPAMRDLMDRVQMLRAENTAIVSLLMDKGVFTQSEWDERLDLAAAQLDGMMELLFPGFRTSDFGVYIHDRELAAETMKKLCFPP